MEKSLREIVRELDGIQQTVLLVECECRRLITKTTQEHGTNPNVESLCSVAVGLRNVQSMIFDCGSKLLEVVDKLAKPEHITKKARK